MIQDKERWWIDFFKGDFSEVVLDQQAHGTLTFMQRTGQLSPGLKVFDQCCGKGYLAHEFDQAGMDVTGIDASEEYLAFAKSHFASSRAAFILGDAKDYFRDEYFDVGINWNTSFAYNTDDIENERMLIPLGRNLRQGGQFFMCTMNPLFIHRHFQRHIVKQVPFEGSSIITIRESRIEGDMMISDWLIVYPDGHRETKYGQTKLYSLEQLREMLAHHDLRVEQVYGDIYQSTYDEDHPSMIIYGHKV